MWERLCLWIDMYYLGAFIVSEITGDKKKLKKKKRERLVGVLITSDNK